jgi:hypothetical protein
MELNNQLMSYFVSNNVDLRKVTNADIVLACLRINTPKAREKAERIMGKKITVCPPAIPPWPPKPVQVQAKKRSSAASASAGPGSRSSREA